MAQLVALLPAGATLLTVVHQPSLLPLLADRVIGPEAGRIAFDCPLAAVDAALLAALYAAPARPAPPGTPGATGVREAPDDGGHDGGNSGLAAARLAAG